MTTSIIMLLLNTIMNLFKFILTRTISIEFEDHRMKIFWELLVYNVRLKVLLYILKTNKVCIYYIYHNLIRFTKIVIINMYKIFTLI